MKDLKSALADRHRRALYRFHRILQSPPGPKVQIDGRFVLNFASNDYLGLAADPRIAKAFKSGIDRWGSGASAAHLLSGHTQAHARLESALAEWLGREKALLFSSGYQANLAAITALLGRGDHLIADRLNHASLIDAARLAQVKQNRFQHNDPHSAERALKSANGQIMIAVESVFSMDGDQAPLADLIHLAKKYQADLMVDEAHGLGVFGQEGRGLCASFQPDQVPILMGTLGKSFGTAGAFIAGSSDLIDYLIQTARPYLFTTASPPALAEATLCSLNIIRSEQERRQILFQLIDQFKQGLEQIGLKHTNSSSPIQTVLLGSSERAVAWSNALWQKSIWVPAIRPPTVPQNQARLRISLTASHQPHQIQYLLDQLHSLFHHPPEKIKGLEA